MIFAPMIIYEYYCKNYSLEEFCSGLYHSVYHKSSKFCYHLDFPVFLMALTLKGVFLIAESVPSILEFASSA